MLKNDKVDFIQGDCHGSCRGSATMQGGLVVGKRDWAQLHIQQGKVEIYSQGAWLWEEGYQWMENY